MTTDTIQLLLKRIYKDSNSVEEWKKNPHEKAKEWGFELEKNTIDVVSNTLYFISNEQQIEPIHNNTQLNLRKFKEEAYKHSRWSFYATLGIHIVIFVFGIIMLSIGMYASFHSSGILGFFIGATGLAGIIYFLFSRPIQKNNTTIGNLVQMEVALDAWSKETACWQLFLKNTSLLEEKQVAALAMRDSSKWAVMLIEDYSTDNQTVPAKEPGKDFFSKARLFLEKAHEKLPFKRKKDNKVDAAADKSNEKEEISKDKQ